MQIEGYEFHDQNEEQTAKHLLSQLPSGNYKVTYDPNAKWNMCFTLFMVGSLTRSDKCMGVGETLIGCLEYAIKNLPSSKPTTIMTIKI